jgi:catechol 2,3-dioxygenase-like lactoylglutathione lyase family enzyme
MLESAPGQTPQKRVVVQPDSARFVEVVNGTTEIVDYRGRRAVKLVPSPETAGKDQDMMAILAGNQFKDGTIEVDVAGAPRPGMPSDSRGFIGIAFRTGAHGEWSEVFYLRPTNGRADDQLRRNHSVQYVSHPDFTWSRLRQENPGVYESYVDLEPGVWTAMKIVVSGTTARLYVNGAGQPCLVVNDLKHGDAAGQIALWAHVETNAFFSAVTTTPSAGGTEAPVLTVSGATFALSVADLDASTKWYVEKLGLSVVMRAPRTDATRAKMTMLNGGGLAVELIQHDDAVSLHSILPAARDAISVHGIAKVGVTVDDFDKTLNSLKARGVEIAYGPWPKRADQPANVIIRDNAGNLIQILGK